MKPGIRLFRKYFTDISAFIWFLLYCHRVLVRDNIMIIIINNNKLCHVYIMERRCSCDLWAEKSPGHCPDGQQKDVAEQLCPSSSAYSLAAGYPASAITLYAVLAGHAVDGELMGHFLGMCNVVYLLGAVRNGGRWGHYYKYHGGFLVRTAHGLFPLVAQES